MRDPIPEGRTATGDPSPLPSPNLSKDEDRASRVFENFPQYNYQWAYRDSEWLVDGEGNVLPDLRNLSKRIGVNGVTKDGGFKLAKAQYQANGWNFIPHDVLGDGIDYVQAYKTHKGKTTHRSIFDDPKTVGDTTKWRFDRAAYAKFVAYLRKTGAIPDPRPEILEPMLARYNKLLQSIPHPDKGGLPIGRYNDQVGHVNRQVEGLKAELERSYAKYGKPQAHSAHKAVDRAMARIDALMQENEASEPVESFECPECERRFETEQGLKTHYTRKHSDVK